MHPPLTTRRLNTAIQVNNLVRHISCTMDIYTSHNYYYSTSSLYFFYTLGQASWPQPVTSGTIKILSGAKGIRILLVTRYVVHLGLLDTWTNWILPGTRHILIGLGTQDIWNFQVGETSHHPGTRAIPFLLGLRKGGVLLL
jgi:hypothetical protein